MIESGDGGFFRLEDGLLTANDAARGPWSADACHGGPVTGLVARALEQVLPHKQLVRLTLNFRRPVPMLGLTVTAAVDRDGREVAIGSAEVRSEAGICVTASSVHIAPQVRTDLPTAFRPHPDFSKAGPGEFQLRHAPHGQPFFSSGVEVAYPPGETLAPGPTTVWMRTLPIVAGEVPSPFQSLCPLADCGNAVSRNAEFTEAIFINPDLTIAVFRPPESDWLASEAMSHWQPNGVGMSQAQLFDVKGAVGFALQTLLVRPITK
ncbi:MAG: thioesterase family protein [Gammaproteobacteria bacterium]|nr:thioesterase family protein [Gammaproteobacteria bacterium]MDH5302647.1 thioesterase family protein [Gammaproteobacteria bacterium]MDH5320916.1 thioesterase family protein [Gammaproteobacteria bacterium]